MIQSSLILILVNCNRIRICVLHLRRPLEYADLDHLISGYGEGTLYLHCLNLSIWLSLVWRNLVVFVLLILQYIVEVQTLSFPDGFSWGDLVEGNKLRN